MNQPCFSVHWCLQISPTVLNVEWHVPTCTTQPEPALVITPPLQYLNKHGKGKLETAKVLQFYHANKGTMDFTR